MPQSAIADTAIAFDAGVFAVMAVDVAHIENYSNEIGGRNSELYLCDRQRGELFMIGSSMDEQGERYATSTWCIQATDGTVLSSQHYDHYRETYDDGCVRRTEQSITEETLLDEGVMVDFNEVHALFAHIRRAREEGHLEPISDEEFNRLTGGDRYGDPNE